MLEHNTDDALVALWVLTSCPMGSFLDLGCFSFL